MIDLCNSSCVSKYLLGLFDVELPKQVFTEYKFTGSMFQVVSLDVTYFAGH